MILVNINSDGGDIVLSYDSPRTISFFCEKVIWENGDYFPEQNYTIYPGNLAFFNPALIASMLSWKPDQAKKRILQLLDFFHSK